MLGYNSISQSLYLERKLANFLDALSVYDTIANYFTICQSISNYKVGQNFYNISWGKTQYFNLVIVSKLNLACNCTGI